MLCEPAEPQRHTASGFRVRTIHGLNMEVRLCGVAGIPACPDLHTGTDCLARGYRDRSFSKVRQSNEMTRRGVLDDHVIARQSGESATHPPLLRERVKKKWHR